MEADHSTRTGHTAMHNPRARLVVLLLRAPHILERRQRRQNRAADPHTVLALGWRDDLDFHIRGRHIRELALHAIGDAGEHGRATGHDDVAVELAADVEVATLDGGVAGEWVSGGSRREGGDGAYTRSAMPPDSIPANAGWKRTSGARKLVAGQ